MSSPRDVARLGSSVDRQAHERIAERTPACPESGSDSGLQQAARYFDEMLHASPETDRAPRSQGGSEHAPSPRGEPRRAADEPYAKTSTDPGAAGAESDPAGTSSGPRSEATGETRMSKTFPADPRDLSPTLPCGDRILQNLLHAPPLEVASQAASAATTEDRIAQIERLGEQLAQGILVSDRGASTSAEVRIQLRESVLQGSEIRLRYDEGQLVVSLRIPSPELVHRLSPHTEQLQQALASRLDTRVRIEIRPTAREPDGDASPGDGRSRNRQDPRDLLEDWDRR